MSFEGTEIMIFGSHSISIFHRTHVVVDVFSLEILHDIFVGVETDWQPILWVGRPKFLIGSLYSRVIRLEQWLFQEKA